jgi:vanillate O-demethylase ferredoxin subunit
MPSTKPCRIRKIDKLSDDVLSFELESQCGPFSSLEPGAHIDVHLGNDLVKQYSVWGCSDDKLNLSIAVKREDNGAGGSIAMHQLMEGDLLPISGPRNHFKLQENAPHYTLVAGGIGVTPIYSMADYLQESGAKFSVHYLVQNVSLAAFASHFENLKLGDNYHLHCDNEHGLFDFKQLVKTLPENSQIYTCGPEPMLNAIMDAVPNHDLHFERFSAASDKKETRNKAFAVKINSSGALYQVGEHETILGVLTANGVQIDSGCAEGICGTCITDVLEGDIDHRDAILSDDEKTSNEYMCVCVSRAKSKQIVLDL